MLRTMSTHTIVVEKMKKNQKKKDAPYLGLFLMCFAVLIVIVITATEVSKGRFDARSGATLGAALFPVAELPSDNLIQNPWFRDDGCDKPQLAPWVSVPDLPTHQWTASNKPSNPSPASGCETSGRISVGEDGAAVTVQPNQDVKMYQIVAANPSNKNLVFDMYWVVHTMNIGTVTVYGSTSNDPNGTWTKVWTPFSYSISKQITPPAGTTSAAVWLWDCYSNHKPDCADAPELPAATTISQGYPYYKIEFLSNLPAISGGFKQTGIYFTAKGSGINPTPPIPTPSPSPVSSVKPSATPRAKASPTVSPRATTKPTPTPNLR